MCRRKRRNKQKAAQKGKTKVKKKRTCCQKLRRKIRKWLCRKIKRCFKKTLFGDPDPRLDDFEIVGINLGDVRDKFKRKKSLNQPIKLDSEINVEKKESFKLNTDINVEKKPTIVTLFRNKRRKSIKLAPIKDAIMDELDRYSISKSIRSKVKSFIDDFRERNLFLGVSKDSQLKITEEEKERIRKLAKKYEKKNVPSKDLDFNKSQGKLKRKISLSPSKSLVLRYMLDDYRKAKFSLSKNNQMTDILNISKDDLKRLLERYESQKKNINSENKSSKRMAFNLNNLSFKFLENMTSSDLKKKFSLTDSKQKILGYMIDDHKKGKFSLSAIPRDIRNDLKTFNTENINQILDYYKLQKKSNHYAFVKQSKLKQLKSDLRAKIAFL